MLDLILTVLFGWAGYWKFKNGKIALGIVWLLTFGAFGFGWLFDIIFALVACLNNTKATAQQPAATASAPPPLIQPTVEQHPIGSFAAMQHGGIIRIDKTIRGYISQNALHYNLNGTEMENYQKFVQAILYLNNCEKLWAISNSKSTNTKENSGAAYSISKTATKILTNAPFYIKTELIIPNIQWNAKRFFFLPDMVLLVENNNFVAFPYNKLLFLIGSTTVIENDTVPKDAKIIGETWKYLNANGTPDKRYSSNWKIPKCRYGKLFLSCKELEFTLYGSNVEVFNAIAEQIEAYQKLYKGG